MALDVRVLNSLTKGSAKDAWRVIIDNAKCAIIKACRHDPLVQRAYVLESGNVIMQGSSAELANNKQVQAAYLGI